MDESVRPPSTPLKRSRFRFGTKAETLEALRPWVTRATILEAIHFSVSEWRGDPGSVLESLGSRFGPVRMVVRSSATAEDGAQDSHAGRYRSLLDVDGASESAVIDAVEHVIASFDGNAADQVLVQPMLTGIAVSGVITTRVVQDGAPYYVLNYDDESGRTDTITGGTGVNKTVLVHRRAIRSVIQSPRVARWVELARELEFVCGEDHPLDIEFAETHDGQLFILQVRRIGAARRWRKDVATRISEAQQHVEGFLEERSRRRPGLLGARSIFGTMPDWNPAEILGTSPRPLAVSLYRRLVTDDAWRLARAEMGYRHPRGEALLVQIGGRPYVDVRNSFNSFLPRDVDEDVGNRLVGAWIERLDSYPELHDKVEFEIAFTVADLDLEAAFPRRYDGLLSPAELLSYRRKLIDLTRGLLDLSPAGTLASALSRIDILAEIQAKRNMLLPPPVSAADALYRVKLLLEECHELGTVPFAIAARHAFVAEALLRSSVRVGALSEHRVWELKQSVPTVTGQLYGDFREALRAEDERQRFLVRYGHLRPGTYDILSLRYDQRPDLFDASSLPDPIGPSPRFVPTADEKRALEKALAVAELDVLDAGGLVDYARRAIQARERAKLIFTRHLSDALELLAVFGEKVELSREDVSFLELEPLLTGLERVCPGGLSGHARGISEKGRDAMETAASLHLGYLVRDVRDIFVIPLHRGAPNFVTDRKIEGETAYVSSRMLGHSDLSGRVVCIESADPGFDWIFTRGISGLITKFGGANSHMAIRCAEFGLPAAVGCGEQTFERLVSAGRVELDCGARVLRPLYG